MTTSSPVALRAFVPDDDERLALKCTCVSDDVYGTNSLYIGQLHQPHCYITETLVAMK